MLGIEHPSSNVAHNEHIIREVVVIIEYDSIQNVCNIMTNDVI